MSERELFLAAVEIQDVHERANYLDQACAGDAALRAEVEALLKSHDEAGSFLDEPAMDTMKDQTMSDDPTAGAALDASATSPGPSIQSTGVGRAASQAQARPGAGPRDATGEWGSGENTNATLDAPPGSTQPADANGASGDLCRGAIVRYFGDYEIQKELGRGGMGVVYKARQVSLNRPVALKMIKAGVLAGDAELRRFQNEAEAVALLDHPGIVPVYEVGDHDGQRYFSMKLVAGDNLAEKLDSFQDNPRAAANLMAQTAEAVHHAHMRGILHRDLKPANILVDIEGRPHVTDFGLAKRVDADVEITASGAIMGTPAYMSPEQASGRRGSITTATDVYGLGAVLYAVLAGKAPFGGDSVIETLDAVRTRPPEPPTKFNAHVPPDLETICLKCLEKDPRRRYASAHELAGDLTNWLHSRPITARRVGSAERAWLWCKRNPWLAGAVGSTAAAVVAVAVISTVFAVEQTRAKNRIKGLAVDLQSSLDQSQRLGGELKGSLKESYTRLARLDFERAQNAFEKEQIGPGLIRLVQSWRSAIAADDSGWQHTARAALSAWRRHHVEAQNLLFHEEAVVAIAFSPAGKTILTGSHDKTARLWDTTTGQPIGTAMWHQAGVVAVAFSPDGKSVLTGSEDRTARLWDAATGRPRVPALRHEKQVRGVAFSPDGKSVVTRSDDNTARLWDSATGQSIGSPMRHQAAVSAVAFSPDGKSILTSADSTARLWDAATGQPRGSPLRHEGRVDEVAFSPDGKTVLTGSRDNTARLWGTATGELIGLPMRHDGIVGAVAFSPDGKSVLTGGYDNTARLWDAATGQPIATPMRHQNSVVAVAFSPDGKSVLTGSDDNTARLWDAATAQPIGPAMLHQESICAVAFSPDGKTVLTGSYDHTARLWDTSTVGPAGLPLQHHSAVLSLAFSPDGKSVLTGSYDNTARLWDAASGQPLGNPMPHQGSVGAVAFSPDGKSVLTGSYDKTARLWDTATGRPLGPPLRHPAALWSAVFSPDGKSVLTMSGDYTARLWDAASGQPLGKPMSHQGYYITAAFSPDGKSVLTGSGDYTARLWDAASGQPLGNPMPHQGSVGAVAFSPDGKSVLTGSYDKTARLWDAATGHPIGDPMQHQRPVIDVTFSPDGKSVLTASYDNTARIWDAATGRPLGPPLRHPAALWCAVFSSDGRSVLTGGYDGTARLWDAATGRPLGPPLRHDNWVSKVAFSPDGKTVLTGSHDKTARLWDVTELPDDPKRVAAWVSKVTALVIDKGDEVRLLELSALDQSRERLETLGGPPVPEPRWSLDPILFGGDPPARARALIQRGRWDEAMAAFDEALAARPLYAPLWAERARFHTARGRLDRAVEDTVRAVLLCWSDPKLAALARSDESFRDEAVSEILQLERSVFFRQGPEVWRGRGRRRASLRDWAGALREFAEPATPVPSMTAPDLLAHACLLRLSGDDEAAGRFADEIRGLPEPVTELAPDGTAIRNPDAQVRLWVSLLDDPPPDPSDLVQRALKYVSGDTYLTKRKGAEAYVVGAALLRAGRLDEAVRRFEQSLGLEPDWPNHGLNAYGLALAHHRLGHPHEARRWLAIAEHWLQRLDSTYAVEAPGVLTGQPTVPVSFEFWVYAQILRHEAAGPILDQAFPTDPFAR